MKQYTAMPGKAWGLGKGPFIFSGKPPACWGELVLHNKSDEKVKVYSIPTVEQGNEEMTAMGFDRVQLAARLGPRGRFRVPAQFSVALHTPPGTYTTKISCGRQREQVVVHVIENAAFQVIPRRVVLRGTGGDELFQTLVVRNDGNVALTFHDLSMVWLEERNWPGRTLVYALRESPEKEAHQAFFDRVLEEFRKSMIPSSRVSLECDKPLINPGEAREIRLGITLPKELKKGRTYFGFIKLSGKRLWLEVQCTGAPKPANRRKK